MVKKDWKYTRTFDIWQYKPVLVVIIAISLLIPVAIYVSGNYITTEATVVRTNSEVELMDGKYVMSQEYVMNVSSDEHRNDVGDEYLAFDYSLWGDIENEYSVCVYSFETGETEVIVDDMNTDCDYVSTDGEYVTYIYSSFNEMLSWYPVGNIAGLLDAPYGSIHNEIIAYEYLTMSRPTENYVAIYYTNNDTPVIIWQAEGESVWYKTPDIHNNVVVCSNNSRVFVNDIEWYDIDTGIYGNMTRYDELFGTYSTWTYPKIWDNNIILMFTYNEGGLPSVSFTEIHYIDINESTETQVLKDRYAHDQYYDTDISQDLVIYDAHDDDLGTWNIFATDITEPDVEFNISVVDGKESIMPHIYIGDEGYGHMSYTRYNSTNMNWELIMRYINDTTLMVDDGLPDGHGNQDIDFTVQTTYNLNLIYIAIISTSVGIGTCGIYYVFKKELV